MDNQIKFENKIYLSSKYAGEQFGYSPDYVARLCRQAKIQGKMVGRTWYAEAESLRKFVDRVNGEREERHDELSEVRRQEYQKNTSASFSEIGQSPFLFSEFSNRVSALVLAVVFVAFVYTAPDTLSSRNVQEFRNAAWRSGEALAIKTYTSIRALPDTSETFARALYLGLPTFARGVYEVPNKIPALVAHAENSLSAIPTPLSAARGIDGAYTLKLIRAFEGKIDSLAIGVFEGGVVLSEEAIKLASRSEKTLHEAGVSTRTLLAAAKSFSQDIARGLPEFGMAGVLVSIAENIERVFDALWGKTKLAFEDFRFGSGMEPKRDSLDEAPPRTSIVVAPAEHAEELRRQVEETFSDEVLVYPDETGRSGIITPVFKHRSDQSYVYMLTPVKETEIQTP